MLLLKKWLACFGVLCLSTSAWNQVDTSFSQLLTTIHASTAVDNNARIEAFIETHSQVPIIEGDTVIFLARKKGHTPPTLLADFNGFLHPRYVKDRSLGSMASIPGSTWYFRKTFLSATAIINYAYAYGDESHTDPLNPNLRQSFGSLTSFIKMPDRATPPEIIIDHSLPRGKVSKQTLASQRLGHDRTIHVYLPPDYEEMEQAVPTVYFHDGSFYVNEARIPQILDYLIAHQRIQPVIAIFDDPVIRGKEYRGDEAYRDYIAQELIPYIDKTYRTLPTADQRAVIGGSRGGLSALHLAHSTAGFGKCGAFSPAIIPIPIPEFLGTLKTHGHSPKQLFISGSVYDYIWYPDALSLRNHFQKSELDFQYQEIIEGHNIPAWRSLLDEMLVFFFPAP